MLKLRDYNYKSLYDNIVSYKDSVKIEKLKEGQKPSIMSDSMFKTMFYNENRIKYSAKFLSYYLDIEYEDLLNNIKLSKGELDKDKERNKGERCDYVAIVNDIKINIEINNNSSKEVLERNMEYAHRLYASKVKRNSDYSYTQVIQFNWNNFSFKGNDKIIDIYMIKNDEGVVLNDKLIFIQIYIPNLRRKWYTSGIQRLSEEERYALGLIEPDILTSKELGGDLEIMEEYIKEAEEVVEDEFFGESYDKEWAWKDLGKQEGSKEIAKAMLKDDIDIEFISKYTHLTKEQINKIDDVA